MNNDLKKQLQKLLQSYPELNGARLSFKQTEIEVNMPDSSEPAVINLTEQAQQPTGYASQVITGHSAKVEIRKSPIHGYGVFAKDIIAAGEPIEECRLLKLGNRANYNHDPVLKDYVWGANDKGEEAKLHGQIQYIALGLGSMYNHSDNPNTKQALDFETEVMKIWAETTIQPGEEIFINYGNKYFAVRDFWKKIKENRNFDKFLQKQAKAST